MNKLKNILAIAFLALPFVGQSQTVTYPKTEKIDTKITYFGKDIVDPYHWLENDRSAETEQWVKSQNEVTFKYLESIPYRETLKKELTETWNYERYSIPTKEGDYTYYFMNSGLQKHSVMYRTKDQKEKEVFIDPNTFSKDGSISMSDVTFSKDGSLCAYLLSDGGSDWKRAIVMNTMSKTVIDTIWDIKFSAVSWLGNEGFYYSSYDKPKEGSALSGKTSMHKLYFHKLGTKQSEDQLIFGGEQNVKRYITGRVSDDQRYLFITASQNTATNELYFKDLTITNSDIRNMLPKDNSSTYVVYSDGPTVYLVTDIDAPNNRMVKIQLNDLAPSKWVNIIPESKYVMEATTVGKNLFAVTTKDVMKQVTQYDLDGKKIREVQLPGLGSVTGFEGKANDQTTYFTFTNTVTPPTHYQYDIATGASTVYTQPKIQLDLSQFEMKQVFYTSKDGTKVPMTISYRKGLKLDGKNPTILYGYGGFNNVQSPTFSLYIATWIRHGGVYAVANLRGGGEYGQAWYDQGRLTKKRNVFDDFIAAANYLKAEKYTSTDYLAIKGGSNGGLLVGATMTIEPSVSKVALPAVGVLDMLRYHKFTAGAGWAYDYGTSDDSKEMFEYLLSYSPVHNVKANTVYPATLVTTGDHDDRVVPAHSFKFGAKLQELNVGNNPQLIRINVKAGHGAGKSTEVLIQEMVDEMSFSLWNMGFKTLPK